MLSIDDVKRIRLHGQYLTHNAEKTTVVRNLNGLQSQFMANAFHSLKIRCGKAVEENNWGEGLVKNWTVRGTVHVFAKEDLPLFVRRNYRCLNFSLPTWWNSRQGWNITPERQKMLSEAVLEALTDAPKTREELKLICRQNGMTEAEEGSMFHPWGGGIRELCERGFMNYTVKEEKEFELTAEYLPMNDSDAECELLLRYFSHFAPATIKDAAYYTGFTQKKIKEIMQKLPLSKLSVDNVDYFYVGELPTTAGEIPKCVLLAGFDQLMLGYKKEENVFLPQEYLRGIFTLSGIVMPAILLEGKVVGKWKHKNGAVTFDLFEPVSERQKNIIADTASQLWDIKKTDFLL